MTDAAPSTPYVGQSLRRREDLRFLSGNGRYVDDIKLPGTLHLAILRAPHAYARITGMDLAAAGAAAGVRLALAGADPAGKIGKVEPNWVVPGTVVPDRPVMAVDRVRFAFPSTEGMSGYYAQQNGGKRNVSIDLNVPGARALALCLCDTADVAVENFRAGTLGFFGLDYETLAARAELDPDFSRHRRSGRTARRGQDSTG